MSQEKNMNKSIQAINRQQTESKEVNIKSKFTSVQNIHTKEKWSPSSIWSPNKMLSKRNDSSSHNIFLNLVWIRQDR